MTGIRIHAWKSKITYWGLTAAMLAGMTAPLFFLYGKAAVRRLFDDTMSIPAITPELFVRSIGIALASAVLCTVFGAFTALFLWNIPPAAGKKVFYLMLVCALIPPFIHVHSWIKAVDLLNGVILGLTGIRFNFTGIGAVLWTTAFSYLPFTAVLIYLGLMGIPREVLELARFEGHPVRVFFRIIVPYAVQFLLIGFLFIFLITVNDYSIPSVFGVNVYALEIFALFSAGGNIYAIALASLPLICLACVLMALISFLAGDRGIRENFSRGASPFGRSPSILRAADAGGVILFLFAAVPILAMIGESFFANDFFNVLKNSSDQILYSIFTSLLAAVFAALPATFYAYVRMRRRRSRFMTFLLAFPFLLPSAILGLSLIDVYNSPPLSAVYSSPVMPAIGLAIRFGILAILYMSFRFERIERDLTDALRLDCSAAGGFFSVVMPMIRQDILACMMMVFALSMGEYGIVLLITPPGYQMVTIKIFNYIHYGATGIVFALNLTVFLCVLAAGLLMMKAAGLRGRAGDGGGSSDVSGGRG